MTLRAFVAVDFPPGEALRRLLQGLRATPARLRVVPPENLHITLKFLGDTEEAQVSELVAELHRAAEGLPPFTVTLQGTGTFPRRGAPRVVWVGLGGGDPLMALAGRVETRLEALGFPRDRRQFSPHLTVARVKGAEHRGELLALLESFRETAFGQHRVEAVRLKRSELRPTGAVYHDVAVIPLS